MLKTDQVPQDKAMAFVAALCYQAKNKAMGDFALANLVAMITFGRPTAMAS